MLLIYVVMHACFFKHFWFSFHALIAISFLSSFNFVSLLSHLRFNVVIQLQQQNSSVCRDNRLVFAFHRDWICSTHIHVIVCCILKDWFTVCSPSTLCCHPHYLNQQFIQTGFAFAQTDLHFSQECFAMHSYWFTSLIHSDSVFFPHFNTVDCLTFTKN